MKKKKVNFQHQRANSCAIIASLKYIYYDAGNCIYATAT